MADFDGDGRLDLAIAATADNAVAILPGHGAGNFKPGPVYRVGPVSFVRR